MSAAAYVPRTVWQPVKPHQGAVVPQPSPFDTTGPSHILAREPGAFRQHQGHRANMPQMALPGSLPYAPPGMMRAPTWRKGGKTNMAARNAYIVAKRDGGMLFKDIALQCGISIARCSGIYKRETQGAAA